MFLCRQAVTCGVEAARDGEYLVDHYLVQPDCALRIRRRYGIPVDSSPVCDSVCTDMLCD